MSLRARAVVFFTILVVTVALDQGSKAWARTLPAHPQPVIAGYWDWELAYNRGAAFSSFEGIAGETGTQIVLSLIALGALIGVGVAASRTTEAQRLKRLALALIAGGALGNVIDRLREGAVTDFVRWKYHDHLWPIFNVADAALLVGVVLLLVDGFSLATRPRRKLAT